ECPGWEDLDHNDLAEVSGALDQYAPALLLRRNGLNLYKVIPETSIGARSMRPMPLETVLDLGIKLAELTPNLQVATSNVFVRRRSVDQILKHSYELDARTGVFSKKLLLFQVLIYVVPANPFAVVPDAIRRVSDLFSGH